MIRRATIVGALLVVLSTVGAAVLPDWDTLRLTVEPGRGLPGLVLGEPLPEEWSAPLGEPNHTFDYHDTGERYRKLVWGEHKDGRLLRGVGLFTLGTEQNSQILDLRIRKVRASAARFEVFLGLPVERLKQRAEMTQQEGQTSYLLPGLAMLVEESNLVEFRIVPLETASWRFAEWPIEIGRGVGPLLLGQTLSEEALEHFGPPTVQERARVLWRSPDGSQEVEVVVDRPGRRISRIRGTGINWKTESGLGLGASEESFLKVHPKGRSSFGLDTDERVVRLPGLRATFRSDSLATFDIFPVAGNRPDTEHLDNW